MELTTQSVSNNPSFFRLTYSPAVAISFLIFLVFWISDFPQPTYDDLFYSGAGLHLAQGGDYSNPLLARQEFPTHFFYIYPPIHSYVMAGWLKLVGISAHSMTAFPLLMGFITAIATIAFLRRFNAPTWLEWLVPWAVSAAFFPSGLRTEPMAIAFIMTGFVWLLYFPKQFIAQYFAFLVLFLGALSSPRSAPLAFGLFCFALYSLGRRANNDRPFAINAFSALFAAAATVILLFLIMIHFEGKQFIDAFLFHAAEHLYASKLDMLRRFIHVQRISDWPMWLLLPVFLVAVLARRRFDAPALIGLVAVLALLIEGIGVDLGAVCLGWYIMLGLLAFMISLLKSGDRRFTPPPLSFLLIAVMFMGNFRNLISIAGLQTGQISRSLGVESQTALQLSENSHGSLLVDTRAARYLYGYRLPANALDAGFCNKFPASFISSGPLHSNDVYVLTIDTVQRLNDETFLPKINPETWIPAKLNFLKLDRFPRRIYIVRPKDCVALRNPDNSLPASR